MTETKVNSRSSENSRRARKPLERLRALSHYGRKSQEGPKCLEEPKPAKSRQSKHCNTERLSELYRLPKHLQLRKNALLAQRKMENMRSKSNIEEWEFSLPFVEDPMMEIYDMYGGPPFAGCSESIAHEGSVTKALASVMSKNSVYRSMVDSTFSTECENYMLDHDERTAQHYQYKLFTKTLQP